MEQCLIFGQSKLKYMEISETSHRWWKNDEGIRTVDGKYESK